MSTVYLANVSQRVLNLVYPAALAIAGNGGPIANATLSVPVGAVATTDDPAALAALTAGVDAYVPLADILNESGEITLGDYTAANLYAVWSETVIQPSFIATVQSALGVA